MSWDQTEAEEQGEGDLSMDQSGWDENSKQKNDDFEDDNNNNINDEWGVNQNDEVDGWGNENEKIKNEDEWNENDNHNKNEISVVTPSLSRQQSWIVLNSTSLQEKQRDIVNQLAEILDVTPSEAGCLLRHNGWKSKKLQTDWFADSDSVRKNVGLTDPSLRPKPVTTLGEDNKLYVQCQSAFCDKVLLDEATALNCGHYFCNDCWNGYLTSQLNSGRTCVFTTCMGMKCTLSHPHKFGCACKEIVPQDFFSKFVEDQDLLNKYQRWLLDSFVEGQRNIKWCPRPGCTNAVSYTVGGTKSVTCQCGYSFCFSCGEVAHSPSPCDLVRNWLDKEKSDDATAIWLAARTKECPKCLVRIEKNKACNHMTCAKCGHSFCWLCKGPWASHGSASGGYYVCNKYEADMKDGKLTTEESAMQENQRTLQKYTYYYKRFKGSMEGIGFTKALADKIEQKMANEDINKYAFLLDATTKLISARRVLQWTYMLAYYLKNGGKKHLFEYQQEMLVGATEALQFIVDNNIGDMDKLISMRKDIINKTSSMDKFRAEMVEQVERGEFEDLLLVKADSYLETWACSVCKTENKKDAILCTGCTACNLHGEQDCKGCASRVKAQQSKSGQVSTSS